MIKQAFTGIMKIIKPRPNVMERITVILKAPITFFSPDSHLYSIKNFFTMINIFSKYFRFNYSLVIKGPCLRLIFKF